MTKVQLSVRIAPDTLTAIDAEAQRQGTSRGHVIDRWLTTQAAALEANAVPIEQQAWYRAGKLASKARDELADAEREYRLRNTANAVFLTIMASSALADAIDVLAGTAPDTSPAGGQ